MLVMATMMIPGEATIISNYLTVSSFNWLDSYQVLIVPYLTSAMGIFLFRQFISHFHITVRVCQDRRVHQSALYIQDPAALTSRPLGPWQYTRLSMPGM